MKTTNMTAFLAFLMIFMLSCTKKVAQPELVDLIFKDLQNELALAQSNLESEEKNLLILKAELKKVVPQSGQIKFATKKVVDSEARIESYKQQVLFFQIKLEMRKFHVEQRYKESLSGGRPWPDDLEIKDYQAVAKLHREKALWGKKKDREDTNNEKEKPTKADH